MSNDPIGSFRGEGFCTGGEENNGNRSMDIRGPTLGVRIHRENVERKSTTIFMAATSRLTLKATKGRQD